ncbi:hypothetical protein [Pseudomonas sp. Q12-87]|uniref:hypothetical protein n=1 Tax=Pseudomonas sp. Q12-87 TaxID=177989 RepID=UPI0012ED7C6D
MRLSNVVDMLFTPIGNKLKLHQINLASFRGKSASDWAAAIPTIDAAAAGVPRYLKRLVGVGLYLQLWEVFQGCAVNRFVDLENPTGNVLPDAFMMTLAC